MYGSECYGMDKKERWASTINTSLPPIRGYGSNGSNGRKD